MLSTPEHQARVLLARFTQRGLRLTVERVREPDNTHWWRVWLRGAPHCPGDFESIARVKPALVALLEAGGHIERPSRSPKPRRRIQSHSPRLYSSQSIHRRRALM